MAYKKASNLNFIEGTIHTVAEIGIENMRTKHVAEYAEYSEATMYRMFPTKEILLRDTFLYIDRQISQLVTGSPFMRSPGRVSYDAGMYAVWRRVYRYLLEHREETIFLIRYRYSSLYTDEVRRMRQVYNGGFDSVNAVFEKKYGKTACTYSEFMLNYIFEMTLSFAEKVINGSIKDTPDTEDTVWLAVSSAVNAWSQKCGGVVPDEGQGVEKTQQAGLAGAFVAAAAAR